MVEALESQPQTTPADRVQVIQAEEIARDLALMDELEAFVQSLPDRRKAAGLGPLPDNAVALSYEED